jgi:hypothetical protein
MSRQELVDAYVSGQIGRRAFVRGLVALGVSAGAATAYAAALNPVEAVPRGRRPELYIPIGTIQCLFGGFRRFGFKSAAKCVRAVLLSGGRPTAPVRAQGVGSGRKKSKGRSRKRK